MKRSYRRGTFKDEAILSLRHKAGATEFRELLNTLRQHLVHTRELLNGRDFLFSGPKHEIRDALTRVVETEHRFSGGLQFDFTQVDEFFLLRIQGPEERQKDIELYFEPLLDNRP